MNRVIAERGGTFTFSAGEVPLSTQFTIVCNDQAGQVATASVTVAPLPTPSGSTGPTPSVAPTPVAARVVVQANPPSLNGVDGGQSTITANVLDETFLPLPGVPDLTLARITGVIVAASAAHRGEAFAGARAVIDRVKAEAPIWKVEVDGADRRRVEGTLPPV